MGMQRKQHIYAVLFGRYLFVRFTLLSTGIAEVEVNENV